MLLNALGLLCGLVGAVIVFIFGLPSISLLSDGSYVEIKETRRMRVYKWISRFGLALIALGFLLQSVALQGQELPAISQSTIPTSLVYGLIVAVLGGALVTFPLWWAIGRFYNLPPKPKEHFSPSATGLIERAVFALLVFYGFPDVLTAMMAWLAIKFGAAWQERIKMKPEGLTQVSAYRAVVVGLVSMLFAVIGGRIARGDNIF